MADEAENLVLEHLKTIRKEVSGVRTDLKAGLRQTNERLAAMEHHLAGFHLSVIANSDELEALKVRIRRIEDRLELREDHPNE